MSADIGLITLEMNQDDFDRLSNTTMNWSSVDWAAQDGRFEPIPDYREFTRIYWFDNYANLLIARAFLSKMGFASDTHSDQSEDSEPWILLTDFGGELK